MTPEEEVVVETPTVEEKTPAEDYIEKLNTIRSGMVDKKEYERVISENRKLADALANGNSFSQEQPKQDIDVDQLRRELFNPDAPKRKDLEFFTKALQLRNALIERGEPDCFLPFNREYIPNAEDKETADRIANEIAECIEYADGDSSVFSVELARRCGKRGK